MKIGIALALKREGEYLLEKLGKAEKIENICGMDFYSYTLSKNQVVVGLGGVGEQESASCATLLIAHFGVDCILNFGYVGSLVKKYGLFQIVKVKSVIQHDYDLTAFGDPLGKHDCLSEILLESDENLSNLLAKGYPSVILASGNSFLSNEEQKKTIASTYSAEICDMEGAGIALVCRRSKIPFAMLKVVSDGLEGDSKDSFAENSRDISGCTEIIYNFLRK